MLLTASSNNASAPGNSSTNATERIVQLSVVNRSSTSLPCNIHGASRFTWSKNGVELFDVKESTGVIYIPMVTQPDVFICEANDKTITFALSIIREFPRLDSKRVKLLVFEAFSSNSKQ